MNKHHSTTHCNCLNEHRSYSCSMRHNISHSWHRVN
uniref:Uncharacterized protein n=1 Tax=Arundo donax TaxID=35708 RepID=A0A0A9HMR1_ARUDO